MLKIVSRLSRNFSTNFKLPTLNTDLANMVGYINASDTPTLTFFEKLSFFTPGNMYTTLDVYSRELLFTLANDYKLGLPAGIIIISLILRGVFFYPNVKGQIAALKMKQLKPFMDRYREKVKLAQMTRNMALMKGAREELKDIQKKKGIDNFYVLVNMFQIPFLITWFLSLRYIAALPQVFPSVTQSFLWVPDLSTYDPYFILPIVSAVFSSYSIIISPGLKNANVMPIMQPFIKYLKYLPFLSLPITGFFPAAINLYWCVLAFSQTLLMTAMNTQYVKSHYAQTEEAPKSQIAKAIFVEEKPKAPATQTDQTSAGKTQTKSDAKQEVNIPPGVEKLQILSKKPKKPKKVE